jgi:putative ABC transport system permease protein
MENFLRLEQLARYLRQHSEYLPLFYGSLLLALVLVGASAYLFRKYFSFLIKTLLRNKSRTTLTSLAVIVLVFVVTLVWSFLVVLDVVMTERSKDVMAIVTERWQVPSQMPFAYASGLEQGAASKPGEIRPEDSMTWQFYGGTLDPTKQSWENFMFFFAMDPEKLLKREVKRGDDVKVLPAMMGDLEDLNPEYVKKLKATKDGCIIGRTRMEKLNKRIGERFKITSYTYKGIDLDFEIVGVFPPGRYDQSGVMNREYLNDALDKYARETGKKHALADKTLGLVWLRVEDTIDFSKMANQIMSSSSFAAPAVKVETASSGISTWLEPYRDLLWGLKWLLVPALLITMALVLANAISISVRERRTEMAVLKVLGFGPARILTLVLGEAVLVGGGSGLLSAGLSYFLVHVLMGGIKFPIAFFPIFDIYLDALWWGLLFGTLTALAGSLVPAWAARSVKVAEVFAKVA